MFSLITHCTFAWTCVIDWYTDVNKPQLPTTPNWYWSSVMLMHMVGTAFHVTGKELCQECTITVALLAFSLSSWWTLSNLS